MKSRFLALGLGALLIAATPPADTPASSPDVVSWAELQGYGQVVVMGDGEVFVGEPSNRTRSGVVYVYRPAAGGGWSEAQQLTAPDAERADGFGAALALDGSTLLVGGTAPEGEAPRVHAFIRNGGDWSFSSSIEAASASEASRFGSALALNGGVAAIGDPAVADGTGAVHLFRADGGSWSPVGALSTDQVEPGSAFGSSLATDGRRLLVGAPQASGQAGLVHVFETSGDGWQYASQIQPPNPTVRGFGASVYIEGDEGFAVARSQSGGRGGRGGFGRGGGGAPSSVHLLTYSDGGRQSGWFATGQLMPYDGGSGFGSSMAVTDSEVLIGASGANAIYVFERGDEPGQWSSTYKVQPTTPGVSGFAASLDVMGSTAIAGATGTDRGSGSVVALARGMDGRWDTTEEMKGPVDAIPSITGGERTCGSQGTIEVFDCGAADLVSFLSITDMGGERGERVNDIWGWTDPDTGREYALVARTNGTSFVDMTEPANPRYVGRLPRTEGTQGSTWRDIKVYANHAYIVSEANGHGMQVFDLTRLRGASPEEVFTQDAHYDGIASAHNIVINEDSGFAYSVGSGGGGETCGGGLHMIDVREPKNPTFAGCFADTETGRRGTGYSHDAMCVNYHGPDEDYQGQEICFGSNENAMSIADVTDKSSPTAISRISYPSAGYTHQGWITEDHRYFFMGDESDEINVNREGTPFAGTRTMIYDVQDLDDPILVKEFFGTTAASDHNLYIRGDMMFQSNYLAGLRILDISDPENPYEVSYFDTVPFSENTPSMSGSWSNYPFFDSGIVIVTSGAEGLFLVRPQRPISQ